MFLNLMRIESGKIFKRKIFWISIVILGLLVALAYISTFASRGYLPAEVRLFLVWPRGLIYVLNYASGFSPLTSWGTVLLMVLVGTITAQEYSWRTLQLWLSRGVPRTQLLLAKFASSLLPTLLSIVLCLLVGGILSAIFSLILQGTIHFEQVNYVELLLSGLRIFYTILPYVALTYMLAVLTRSTVAAVAGGLVFLLIIEPLLGQVLPLLGKPFSLISLYLPSSLSSTIALQNYALAKAPIPTLPPNVPGFWLAAILLALYTIIFCGVAIWSFRRQNLTD